MRELRSLFPPIFPRLAKIAGCHVTTIRERASREGWPKLSAPRNSMMRVVTQQNLRDEADLRARVNALAAANEGFAKDVALIELADDVSPGDIARQLLEALQETVTQMKSGPIDKGRVDSLLSMVRVAERIDDLKDATVQQEQKRSDEELAGILALSRLPHPAAAPC
ncbi:MAG: hypothetical protein KF810_05335 [Rhizobiaceae bacterium]|nr:hypothetical protein [Rhizobiaceae bacterium]